MGDPAKPSRPDSQAIQEPAAAKGTRGRKKGATVNKAQKIRDLAREMIDGGFRPRPSEIVEELWRREKIKVSGPQVSMALRGTGMEFRPPKEPQPLSLLGIPPEPKTAMGLVSVDDLLSVRKFIERIGTWDKAMAALLAYRHLGMEGVRQEKSSDQSGGDS